MVSECRRPYEPGTAPVLDSAISLRSGSIGPGNIKLPELDSDADEVDPWYANVVVVTLEVTLEARDKSVDGDCPIHTVSCRVTTWEKLCDFGLV
jgi:hypothetical protein